MSIKDDKDIMAAAPMPDRLRKNKRVMILTEDNVEDSEFFYPYYRLTEAGYDVDVVTLKGRSFKGKHGQGLQHSKAVSTVSPEDYELLYLPGGKAPAELRKHEEVLDFVRRFAHSGKHIAALCHGPQILFAIEGLVRGKRIAAWPEIRDEVEKAGAVFTDEALVEDGQFITGRMPGDLHRHLHGVLQKLEKEAGREQARTGMAAA
jgi:protease I